MILHTIFFFFFFFFFFFKGETGGGGGVRLIHEGGLYNVNYGNHNFLVKLYFLFTNWYQIYQYSFNLPEV